ncbi:beta-propeller domain-containing protein [Actinomadura vinacea]|uniref:Beta-propeller domain-containing protein n=1 Tax=Actinomadura vinacea TaxID=115336 RepID=A0ABN3IZ90_9ACTN
MPSRRRALWIACVPLAVLASACEEPIVDPRPVAPPVALVSYNGCDDLLKGLRAAAERKVGPYGLDGTRDLPPGRLPDGAARARESAPGASSAKEKAPGYSGTNTHEPGADEPDLVKTDGNRIVTLARGRLQVVDARSRKIVHRLDLGGSSGQEQLLLSGDRVLVLSRGIGDIAFDRPSMEGKPVPSPGKTTLTLISLAGTPRVVGSLTTASEYVDARQTGSTVHVMVKSAPRIDFPEAPQGGRDAERQALERNRRIVRSAPLDAWLPSFEVRGPQTRTYRTPCENVSRPGAQHGTTVLSVLTLDLARDLGDPRPVAVAGDGQTVYGNGRSLYVTGRSETAPTRSTHIHKFDVTGGKRPRYVASGSVPGRLLNQYSMSELEGRLRIATTRAPSATARPDGPAASSTAVRSQSAVYVLGPALDVVGKVDGLGKGERIYSVRFIGTTAYVVTFRQVDPLYVVDLRDARRPRVTGELKITGYSAYLHPVAGGRLLGVGQEADPDGRTSGTQVSLFDVNGPPRRVGVHRLPGSSAAAEYEPHAFLHWPASGLTVLPISRRDGGNEALVLRVDGSGLRRVGTVENSGDDGPIRRSLIVGDTLWTVSETGARATDPATLDERGRVRF